MNLFSRWAILWIALSFFTAFGQNCTTSATFNNVTCNGGNDGMIFINPAGGVAPYTMVWSNNMTGFVLQGLPAGCYTGTLMDASSCSVPVTVCITQPTPLMVTLTQNGNNLIATATGGTPPYTYSWSNGSTTNNIQPQTPGVYTVTVVDANGCMSNGTYTWSPNLVNTSFSGVVSIDCDQDGTQDSTLQNVPLIFTNSGTNYYDTLVNSTLTLALSNTGYYTIAVDNTWLMTHGYQVQSINPNPIQVTPGGSFNFNINLVCDTNATNLIINGIVFCDGNNNGIQEAGEMPINNALVIGNVLGTQVQSYANANGVYSLSIFANPVDSVWVSIASNFILFNGLTPPQTFQQIMGGWNMNNPQTLNIGLNCNYNGCVNNLYQGYVYCDANGNNVFDNGENPMVNAPVTMAGSNATVTVYTDSSGLYNFSGAINNTSTLYAYINATYLNNYGYSNVGGQSIQGSLGSPIYNNFAVNCTPCTNLSTYMSHSGTYYQGQIENIYLTWNLSGPTPCNSYYLKLKFPSNVTPQVNSISLPNFTIQGDTLIWLLSNVNGYQSAVVPFLLPTGLTTNLTQVYQSFIIPNCNVIDCQPNNNQYTLTRVLGNSYDPNQKTVVRPYATEQLMANEGEIYIDGNNQEVLTYTIDFQNTGTAPAQNIYIIDTLEQILDVSTFDVFEWSHTMQASFIGDHIVRFDFPQIWLPDSNANEVQSHGHVRFRIQEAPVFVSPTFDTIQNTGYIYFDWNDAIVTNTTLNINTVLSGINEQGNENFKIFPNPGNNALVIQGEGEFSYQIVDLSGRILYEGTGENSVLLETITWQAGSYLVRFADDHIQQSKVWVKLQ